MGFGLGGRTCAPMVVCFTMFFVAFVPMTCSALPGMPSLHVVQGTEPYSAGETITIHMISDCSNWPSGIVGFNIVIWLQTSARQNIELLVDTQVSAFLNGPQEYSADYQWKFPDAGYYAFDSSAYDSQNINSGFSELWLTSYVSQGATPPSSESPQPSVPVSLMVISIIAVIAAIIVVFFAVGSHRKNLARNATEQRTDIRSSATESRGRSIKCPWCSAENPLGTQACMSCGRVFFLRDPNISSTSMPGPTRPNSNTGFCKYCGKSMSTKSAFCKYCGKKLNQQNLKG